jgi:hypothetical protein
MYDLMFCMLYVFFAIVCFMLCATKAVQARIDFCRYKRRHLLRSPFAEIVEISEPDEFEKFAFEEGFRSRT